VGLSILSGAHGNLFPRVTDEMRKRGLNDVIVISGGIIPKEDVPALKDAGISAVFDPGTTLAEIVEYVRENAGG